MLSSHYFSQKTVASKLYFPQRTVVNLDGITVTLIYRVFHFAKLSKLDFDLHVTDLYILNCLKPTIKTKGKVVTAAFREGDKYAESKNTALTTIKHSSHHQLQR